MNSECSACATRSRGSCSRSLSGSAHALEIWLASTERCNSCAIYERAAQQRGYGRALRYGSGGGALTIPILSIDKSVLAADIAEPAARGRRPEQSELGRHAHGARGRRGARDHGGQHRRLGRQQRAPPLGRRDVPAGGARRGRRPGAARRESLRGRSSRATGISRYFVDVALGRTARARAGAAGRPRVARAREPRRRERGALGLGRDAARQPAVHPDADRRDSLRARAA